MSAQLTTTTNEPMSPSMAMARTGVGNVFDAPPPPPPPYPPPSPSSAAHKRRMQQQQQQHDSTNAHSGSPPRQQLDPPPQQSHHTDDNNNITLARMYKAEAEEAKIHIESQDQRIQELQAELDEIRSFQKNMNMECESSSRGAPDAPSTEGQERENNNISKDDAELIEALAEELETMEKEMNAAQARVAELEKELRETNIKSEEDANMMMTSYPTQREAELKKQLEIQQQELNNAKNDAREGVNIVKDLHGALRLARAERDEARSTLATLRSDIENHKMDGGSTSDQSAEVRGELEKALKAMRNERDVALLELSSLFEEVNSLRECSAICDKLEQSNNSLQTELEILRSQSGPERMDIHEMLVEARAREELMKQEYNKLLEESKQMESALEEIVIKFEEQRTELSMQTAALEELQGLHVTNIAELNNDHATEMEQMRLNHEDAIQTLQDRHAQELRVQSDHLQSRESEWEARLSALQEDLTNSVTMIKEYEAIESSDRIEIENLQNALKEMKKVENTMDMDQPHDELVAGLQVENANLNAELRQLREDHRHVSLELESKSLELTKLQSSLEQQVITSDGDELLPKVEQVVQQTETSSTQDETEVEATFSSSTRGDELSTHSDQMSRIEKLERDLARSKKANTKLEEALHDMQVALVAVSSRITIAPSRKEIEDDVLREYCAHRLAADK